jgi:hypothetical protein
MEHMRIASGGNVGIGTDDPDENLHIESGSGSATVKVEATNSADVARFRMFNDLGTNSTLQLFGSNQTNVHLSNKVSLHGNASSSGTIIAAGNGDLEFYVGNLSNSANERMRITDAGLIGIGVISPEAELHIDGGVIVGEGNTTCDTTHAGEIRFDGTNFFGCDGTTWNSLDN